MSCLVVFIYGFVISYTYYLKSAQNVEYIDFDIKVISAGDYSVVFDISYPQITEFTTTFYNRQSPIPFLLQFKIFIKTVITNKLKRVRQLTEESY
jgi:hypothetical protein